MKMKNDLNKYGELNDGGCPHCGEMIKPDWKACPHCGNKLEHEEGNCVECGSPLKPGWRACPKCGCKVGKGTTQDLYVEYVCEYCEAKVRSDWAACPECGRELTVIKDIQHLFIMACESGDISKAQTLLAYGADLNIGWDEAPRCTPLDAACDGGQVAMVKWLVERGANPNGADLASSWPVINRAARHENEMRALEMVQFLIDAGANARTRKGMGVLFGVENKKVIALLKRHGAREC